MNEKTSSNSVTDIFSKQIAEAVSHHPITIQPELLRNIIAGTVGEMLQEMENLKKAEAAAKAPTITECGMEYIADRAATGHCTSKTGKENLAIISCVVRIIGEKAINQINHQDMVAARQTLLQLPPNMNKSPKYRHLTIGQILDLQPGKKMSLRTVNKHLIRFSSFLNWCCQRGYNNSTNPFKGSQIRQKQKVSAARKLFSTADLQQLFAPGNFKFSAKDLWRGYIMLLGLTTGMRLEEICQLQCDDIVFVGGIACIDINSNGDKRLKNPSAERVIPIHSVLVDHFDFLAFVAKQASFSKRLFPALHRINGCFGHAYSKWFGKYCDMCAVTDPGKVFHSFRHGFASYLKNLDIQVYVAAEVLGHTVPGMTYGHYGKKTTAEKMSKAIGLLNFDAVLTPVFIS